MSKESDAYERGQKDGEWQMYRKVNLRRDATGAALDILGRFTTDPISVDEVIEAAKKLEAHWRSGS